MMGTKMTAWHTGNAGVVIQVLNIEEKGCAAIGFDVFARQPGGLYPDTPEAIRQELLRDIREKKLGTLVFTHEHADHFCPEDVVEALKMNPDLRIISTEETIRRIRALEPEAGRLMALATGADTYKLKYGHRGGNHPVKDLETGRVYISSQNHGYAVDVNSLNPAVATAAFENVNDKTNEGLKYTGKNIFTVQFHPEACPGPQDSGYLFDRFIRMMEVKKNA